MILASQSLDLFATASNLSFFPPSPFDGPFDGEGRGGGDCSVVQGHEVSPASRGKEIFVKNENRAALCSPIKGPH
jgi:hypothetical protein